MTPYRSKMNVPVDMEALFSRVLQAVGESTRLRNMATGARETADDLVAESDGRANILMSADRIRSDADDLDGCAEEWDRIAESFSTILVEQARRILAEREAPVVVRPCGFRLA